MKRYGPQLALLAMFVAVFCAAYPGLLTGEKVFGHDSIVWYGSFHYYLDTLAQGRFPYWDPYLGGGTYFYPYMPLHGMLEPIVLLGVPLARWFDVSYLALYVGLRLFRLLVFGAGSFLLYRRIGASAAGAVLASGVLVLSLPHSYFVQFGALDTVYLSPFALFFLLRLLEEPAGRYRYMDIAGLAFVTGISMVIYVPSFYIFNLMLLLVPAFLLRIPDLASLRGAVRQRSLMMFLSACVAGVVLMSLPPVVTLIRDASGEGELFPMQRIIQRNDRVFKKIMASEVGTGSLAKEFTNQRAVFNSWGNIAGLLFPDIRSSRFFVDRDLTSYIHQYIGIIPLVLCIVGFIHMKSRYRYLLLVMLAVVFVNGFSAGGVHDQPYNVIQRLFNAVFPPLQMYQGRENFGYFVLLYLCGFLAVGATSFLEGRAGTGLLVAASCVAVVAVKIAVSWLVERQGLTTSGYDVFVMAQVALFGAGAAALSRGRLPAAVFRTAAVAVMLADLFFYNRYFAPDILREGEPLYRIVRGVQDHPGETGDFQLFREPAVAPLSLGMAFQETMMRSKGALSMGFNHSLYTTRRFYDFFTHVPLENQFVLNGMVYPVLRFFPLEKTMTAKDGKEALLFLEKAPAADLAQRLVVEEGDSAGGMAKLEDFEKYQDLPGLSPDGIFASYSLFVEKNGDLMRGLRADLSGSLFSPDWSIEVARFTENELSLRVDNRVEGYLYYADGWSKYWEAFDGTRRIPVLVANYNFKAVRLASGLHDLRFVFNPAHYRWALVSYCAGVFVLVLLVAAAILKSRRELRGSESF